MNFKKQTNLVCILHMTNRYVSNGRRVDALVPTRSGPEPKYKEMPNSDDCIEEVI